MSYSETILKSLEIMWKGMLAIFIVITIIAATTVLINYLVKSVNTKKINKKENKNDDNY